MNLLERSIDWAFGWKPALQNLLLLATRLVWGTLFLLAGFQKLTHLKEVSTAFQSLGIPSASTMAFLVAIIEFLGGLLLLLGVLSRTMSLLLVSVMMGAYFFAHAAEASTLQGFIQAAPYTFVYASLVVLAFGPGPYALDRFIQRSK